MSAPATPSSPLADADASAQRSPATPSTPASSTADPRDPHAVARQARPTGTSRPGAGAFDDEDEDEPMGNPADLRDEGVLESLGKAVSSPVRSAAGEEAEERPHAAPRGPSSPSTQP